MIIALIVSNWYCSFSVGLYDGFSFKHYSTGLSITVACVTVSIIWDRKTTSKILIRNAPNDPAQ